MAPSTMKHVAPTNTAGNANRPNEPHPSPAYLARNTHVHIHGLFRIFSRKLPISRAGPIAAMEARLGIRVPEMMFGDNLVAVEHVPSGWTIAFSAEAALDTVDKTGKEGMLKVAYAWDWTSTRGNQLCEQGVHGVVRPFDWSYSCAYAGTETARKAEEAEQVRLKQRLVSAPPSCTIPLDLLRRRDPILFFDEVMLYESELDDNGISMLSVKVRVMQQRMLMLCRLYMRLDNVLVRVRDTRVYVDFDTQTVTREYTAKEDSFANVTMALQMMGLLPDQIVIALRDSNQVANLLRTAERRMESVCLAS